MGLAVVTFDVPCPAGGPSRPEEIAYSLDEINQEN